MNPTTGKEPRGLRLPLKVGLAVALVALVIQNLLSPKPKPPPPQVKSISRPHTRPIAVNLTDAPTTSIDAEELANAGRERSDNALGMAFCWCPPGQFTVGGGPKGPSGRYLNSPPARVTIHRGYWMGKFEVTQAQWQKVTGRSFRAQRYLDPSQPRPLGDNSKRDHAGLGPDYPIYFTSYLDAEDFCYRLTETEHEAGQLEWGWAYRLPTESQWEYACRAGTTTATSFGDKLGSDRANFDGTAAFNNGPAGPFLRNTTQVGKYPANAWGLHDMLGNVWEWCYDDSPPRPDSETPRFRPTATATSDRPRRGGCWYEPGHNCLPTSRQRGKLNGRGSGLGFRVALVPIELWREATAEAEPGTLPQGPGFRASSTGDQGN